MIRTDTPRRMTTLEGKKVTNTEKPSADQTTTEDTNMLRWCMHATRVTQLTFHFRKFSAVPRRIGSIETKRRPLFVKVVAEHKSQARVRQRDQDIHFPHFLNGPQMWRKVRATRSCTCGGRRWPIPASRTLCTEPRQTSAACCESKKTQTWESRGTLPDGKRK